MTTYIFVNPSNAPQGNVKIKAATSKKAIQKFKLKHSQARGFSLQSAGGFNREVYIFYYEKELKIK
jgi:hypothetical protein